MNKIACIVQARTGSIRLPNKVLKNVQDKFRVGKILIPEKLNHPSWRWCVDEEADFEFIKSIYNQLYKKR